MAARGARTSGNSAQSGTFEPNSSSTRPRGRLALMPIRTKEELAAMFAKTLIAGVLTAAFLTTCLPELPTRGPPSDRQEWQGSPAGNIGPRIYGWLATNPGRTGERLQLWAIRGCGIGEKVQVKWPEEAPECAPCFGASSFCETAKRPDQSSVSELIKSIASRSHGSGEADVSHPMPRSASSIRCRLLLR